MYLNKTLSIYPGFIIAFALVAMVFATSTTYTQLGISILLYSLLAIIGYKIFLGKNTISTATTKTQLQDIPAAAVKEQVKTQTNSLGIADIDKRTFLKLIGATGISFFLISIFGQKVQSLLFGQKNLAQVQTLTGNPPVDKASVALAASPTDGYSISEVDDSEISYYGFTNKEGQWFIMRGDTNTGAFRYARGRSNFPDNWKKRQSLDYDYFYQVFL